MQRILVRSISFSALFAQNDRMAIGAVRAMRETGLHVPEDVSVIGFDDTPGVEYFDPPLTTMRQHPHELGSTATQLLIKLIEEPDFPPKEVLLKTELIRRSSCVKYIG
jgi:LacI family repressor for deo operon, udp, cdd, tsx, nupC, and nupG